MKLVLLFASVFIFGFVTISLAVPLNLISFDGLRSIGSLDLPFWGVQGYNMVIADLGRDGKSEIILGSLSGQEPKVYLYRADGSKLNEFYAYGQNFKGGVSVAVGDINGDGKREIITGAGEGGGPQIRIFDSYGRIAVQSGFFAFNEALYRNGVSVATADIDGDDKDEIVVASGYGAKPQVRIFNFRGEMVGDFEVDDFGGTRGINVAEVDIDGDGVDEILISGSYGSVPKVTVYRGNGSLRNEFLAYEKEFRGGVMAIGADIDGDGKEEIITSPGFTGALHIKIFDNQFKVRASFLVGDEKDDNGLNIGVGDLTGDGKLELTSIIARRKNRSIPLGHYLNIDISDQTFTYYDNGYELARLITSTGKPSTPTRLGQFKAISKYTMAYGAGDGQTWGMPNFVGFYTSGNLENGIHSLPYINGVKEGSRSLGTAVSHGCVRLADDASDKFFSWIQIGDRIDVTR